MRTYYDVLGVDDDASVEEIRRAYRVRSRLFHPDRVPAEDGDLQGAATAAMSELTEAYSVLADPGRRAAYDALLTGTGSTEADRDDRSIHDLVFDRVAIALTAGREEMREATGVDDPELLSMVAGTAELRIDQALAWAAGAAQRPSEVVSFAAYSALVDARNILERRHRSQRGATFGLGYQAAVITAALADILSEDVAEARWGVLPRVNWRGSNRDVDWLAAHRLLSAERF